jgi:hypothetical protein
VLDFRRVERAAKAATVMSREIGHFDIGLLAIAPLDLDIAMRIFPQQFLPKLGESAHSSSFPRRMSLCRQPKTFMCDTIMVSITSSVS